MAQQDTGLGWSAKSEWLLANPGNICALESFDPTIFTGQPVGVGSSATDFANRGHAYASNGTFIDAVLAESEDADVFVFAISGRPQHFIMASKVENAGIYLCYKNIGTGNWGTVTHANCNSTQYISYGWYTFVITHGGYAAYDVPVYSTYADAFAALNASFVQTYGTKDNAGYCVGSLVTWYTPDGVEQVSPILISTDEDAVEMSLAGYTSYKNIRHYDGLTFYMNMFVNLPHDLTSTMEHADLRQFAAAAPSKVFELLAADSFANIVVITSPDPYEDQTGESEEGGGDGEQIVDDDVDFTTPPTSMAVASGFITLFVPSQAELNSLANYMWSPLFDVDTLKKLFANPMDCILGLSVYPFPISASGTKVVSVGGVATTVSMGYTIKQYWPVDCGSVYVPKQWDAYMDYAPYTKFNIFLPYIGFRPISADDIMGKTISLRYLVDILSGACNAELKCGDTVLYSWAGSCAAQIPITGNDWRSAITAGISIAGSVAATVLTQGASAPMIAGTIASATVNSAQLKPEVQRSGAIAGASGFVAGQRPYLVRTNPRSAIPANQNKFSGYPSFVTVNLGSLTGYNEIYSVHLEGVPATGAELDEIESILKGGAIF